MGALYGLGFVHAKDRLWQLNFYRLLVNGRLAEILGSAAVPVDFFVRTVGLPRAAKALISALAEEERVAL
jgi:penicillin amidase